MDKLENNKNYSNKTFEGIRHIDMNIGVLENYKQF